MRISFKSGLSKGCEVLIIFDSLVDAVHHFKILFEYSGSSPFTATIVNGTTLSFSAVPFFGGKGIGFYDLEYDRIEFINFSKSALCANGFDLFFGFEEKGEVLRVEYEANTHLKFSAYTVE